MRYEIGFPSESVERRFARDLERLDRETRGRILRAIEGLTFDPRPSGKKFKFLKPPFSIYNFVAECRLRVGDWRVLYNVDDKVRRVHLIAVRRRPEKTYR